jgi:hypothetical protein
LTYTSTLLPQTNEPLEIQKACLDLLKKINELSTTVDTLSAHLEVTDGLGHVIHKVPDATILNKSYPMGHLYLHSQLPSRYTLTTTAPSVWTAYDIITDGATNINGVRLKIYSGSSYTGNNLINFTSVRPFGTDWGFTATSFTPQRTLIETIDNGYVKVYADTVIIDVPVLSNKVEIITILGTVTAFNVQQLGVWI